MAKSAELFPSYSWQDHLPWEGRWELIEGVPLVLLDPGREEAEVFELKAGRYRLKGRLSREKVIFDLRGCQIALLPPEFTRI